MEESIQRQLLVDVDRQTPACLHRTLRRTPGQRHLDAGGVGPQLGPAIDVPGELAGPLGMGNQIGEPGRAEGKPEVDRRGPGAPIGAASFDSWLRADETCCEFLPPFGDR